MKKLKLDTGTDLVNDLRELGYIVYGIVTPDEIEDKIEEFEDDTDCRVPRDWDAIYKALEYQLGYRDFDSIMDEYLEPFNSTENPKGWDARIDYNEDE